MIRINARCLIASITCLFTLNILSAQCPQIEAIMVDACGTEQLNEFVIINSGGGFNTSDIQLSYDVNNNIISQQNNDINIDINNFASDPTPCGLQPGNPAAFTGCTNIIPVGPGVDIPANAIVVLQNSAGSTGSTYNFSTLCGAGQCIYVIASSCTRTAGGFSNGGAGGVRTTIFEIAGGCMQTIMYNQASIAGGNGAYYLPLSNTYGNGGCAVPPSSPAGSGATVNQPPNVVACAGDAINVPFSGTGTSYNWTNSNVNIGLGASGTGDIDFTAANVATTQVGTITVTPQGTCPGPPKTFTITVNPGPTVTQPTDVIVCGGTLVTKNFTGSPVGTTFTWTNDNTNVGLGASGNGNISFTSANVTMQEVANITVTPVNGPCPGTPLTFSVTVNPRPVMDDPPNITVCANEVVSVPFTSTGSPTFNWTNSNTGIGLGASGSGDLNFTAANVGSTTTGTITITPTENGCPGTPQSFTITVNRTPAVNQPANVVVCGGAPVNVNLSGAPAGVTFTWDNDNTAVGLAASGSGNISFTSANVTSQEIAFITVTPMIGTCPGPTRIFSVTVNPVPTVDDPANEVVCAGEGVSVIFTGNGNPNFTWTNTNPAIGLGASGSGDLNFTAANVATTQTGTITITPTLPGCPGTPQTMTITVNPAPSLTQPSNVTVCAGAPVNVNFSGTPVGVTYSWTNDNTNIGLGASGNGNISFTSASVTTQQVATITVTPQFGSCPGTSRTFTVTINPSPTVDDPMDQTVCAGAPVSVTFTGTGNPTFNWTNSNPAIGLGASGTGNLNFTAANVATTQTGTITITPSLPGCPGPPQTMTITVNPAPTLTQPSNITVCAGSPVNANFSGTPVGVTFNWTNSNTNIGLGASGTGNISFTSASVTAQEVATITVTPQFGTCPGTPRTFTVTINPAPAVNPPADVVVCGGQPVAVNFSGTGASYSWTNSNTAIGLGASGNGNISFTSANVAATTTSQITVTPAAAGCPGIPTTFDITIEPQPSVQTPGSQSICSGESVNISLTGTSGTTFNWTNSNTAIGLAASGSGDLVFTAANLPAQQTATITVTPVIGTCTGTSIQFVITLKPTPQVTQPASPSVCPGNVLQIDFSGNLTGTTFSWTNDNTAIGLGAIGTGSINFTAAVVSSTQTGNISVTPSLSGCTGIPQTFSITVNQAPSFSNPGDQAVCSGNPLAVNFSGNPVTTVYNWTNSNTNIGLGASGTGDINFTAAVVTGTETGTIVATPTANGCTGPAQTFNISVVTSPTVANPGDTSVCAGVLVNLPFSGGGNTVYNWTNSNTAIGLAASGTGTINFTAANVTTAETAQITVTPVLGACTGAAETFRLTVNPLPSASITGVTTVCNGNSVSLTAGGGGNYQWDGGQTIATINVSPADTTTYTVTVTNTAGCTDSKGVTVIVHPTDATSIQLSSCSPADTGIVVTTLMNNFGCDSIVTQITALLPKNIIQLSNVTCNPNNAGVFTQNLLNIFGCDSTVTTTITFDPTAIDTTMLSAKTCNPAQVGNTQVQMTGVDGCDSLIITSTSLLPSYNISLNDVTCKPADAGVFTQPLFTAAGCDSIITTTVVFDPSLIDTTYLTAQTCNPAQVGTMQAVSSGIDGCDSLVITSTSLLPSYNISLSAVTCKPANAGVFTQPLFTAAGCDSIITTTVVFDASLIDTTYLTAQTCDPAQVGVSSTVKTGSNGCDSILVTTTTLLPGKTTNLSAVTCKPANAGVFTQNLFTTAGCDSTVITTVVFDASLIDTTYLTAQTCNPAQVGISTTVKSGVNGCDSILITTTTLLPGVNTNLTDYTCKPANAGVFTQNLFTTAGCDSTVVTTVIYDASLIDTTYLNTFTCDQTQVGTTSELATGSNGCDSVIIKNVVYDPTQCSLVANTVTSPASCSNSSDGSAIITVTAGTAPFQYTWTDAAGHTGTGQIAAINTPAQISGLSAGNFTVSITQSAGPGSVITATIAAPAPLLVQATAQPAYNGFAVSCPGASDGSATTTATGGTAPLQFVWNGGGSGQTCNNLSVGTYTVTVTDQNNCTNSASVVLSAPPPLVLQVTVERPECGDIVSDASVTTSGGVNPYKITLDSNLVTGSFPALSPGNHLVVLTDANNCTTDTAFNVSPKSPGFISLPADTTIQLGSTLTISATANTDVWTSLTWNPLPDPNCAGCLEQTWVPTASGPLSVTLVDTGGCVTTASMYIRVKEQAQIFIPNVISPNGDNNNDVFLIGAGPSVTRIDELNIFDRWGNLVYHLSDPIAPNLWPGWDGTAGGKKVGLGVYVYYLRIKLANGESEVIAGDITVVKQ
jgi:gliding motility-associated-like protein